MSKLYTLRYGILDPNIIFNEIGPYSGGPAGWDEESVKKREEVALRHIKNTNDACGFFTNLEKSILKEGFRNPILVNAGWCPRIRDRAKNPRLPLEMQDDHSKILSCNTNGGSRLWVAQNHNLEIPCIIADYVDRFPEFPILETKEDVLHYFTDLPKKIMLRKDEIRVRYFPQV